MGNYLNARNAFCTRCLDVEKMLTSFVGRPFLEKSTYTMSPPCVHYKHYQAFQEINIFLDCGYNTKHKKTCVL